MSTILKSCLILLFLSLPTLAQPGDWSLWRVVGSDLGYLDLQGSHKCVTPTKKGTWGKTSDGKVNLFLGGKKSVLALNGNKLKGGGLVLEPLCRNYNKVAPKPLKNGVTPKTLAGSLWHFKSKSWNGYIDFRKKGVYWTHWGFGKWSVSSNGTLTMRNDYDSFSFKMKMSKAGNQMKGSRSDGDPCVFTFVGSY